MNDELCFRLGFNLQQIVVKRSLDSLCISYLTVPVYRITNNSILYVHKKYIVLVKRGIQTFTNHK